MDVELKPCICGAPVDQEECPYPTVRKERGSGRQVWTVSCTNGECGWQAIGWGADGARKAWNTRHDHSPDAGKVGEAEQGSLRFIAKRNLRRMIEIGSTDKATMLLCLEELS